MATKVDCVKAVKAAMKEGEISDRAAAQILDRMNNLAKQRMAKTEANISEAIRDIAGQIKQQENFQQLVDERNRLLGVRARRDLEAFVTRFKTAGQGLRAFLVGDTETTRGGRLSVDYQGRALEGKYFGRLVAELEQAGAFKEFKRGANAKDLYIELGELREGGKPGRSENLAAQRIAPIVDGVLREMEARMDRAGAYTPDRPAYERFQAHDRDEIRRVQAPGYGSQHQTASYKAWDAFTRPLLDAERTFQGRDPDEFMKGLHQELYSGISGTPGDDAEVDLLHIHGSLANKVSRPAPLHFLDAESAFAYNERFGIKHIRDAITSAIHYKAKSIALMENLGPNAENNLALSIRNLQKMAAGAEDSAEQLKSLSDWRVKAASDVVLGKTEISKNPTFSRNMQTVRALAQLAKMGSTTIGSFADRAFMQSEMAYQGMGMLTVLGKQITGLAARTADQKQTLRMMGVALDGLLGNVASRYSMHDTMHGWAHRAQRSFFDLNFLNWWTDVAKASSAELMAAHLGEHSHLEFEALPESLARVLGMYEIDGPAWEAIRSTAWQNGDTKWVTADKLGDLPEAEIDQLLKDRGLNISEANRQRQRDRLESQLRTYFADRIDTAIPTPGAAERTYTTLGTQPGTPEGEAMRMIGLFKSFPITVLNKVVGREVYGRGYDSVGQWLMHDHKGKFALTQVVAMTFAAGYLSGVVRDALRGKTPKELVTDGSLNWNVINDAMLKGGGLGILGDMMFTEFDRDFHSFLGYAAGPVLGQMDTVGALRSSNHPARDAGKLLLDNAPFINLFYIRPVLDYFVLWNLQEMMNPGTLERQERNTRKVNHQDYWLQPSDYAQ